MSGGVARSDQELIYPHYDRYGGIVLAVSAVILFGCSFLMRNAVPLTVLGSIIVLGAVGIAVAMGKLKVQNQQDFYGGMALMLLSLTAFVASNDLPGMRGFAFGPGTAPRLFAFSLAALSIAVVVNGLLTQGPRIGHYNLRGIIFITSSILVFAACIRPLGLVIAAFSCTMCCAAAADDVRWRETVLWAAVLTAFCSFLFPYGLNLPFQLWPRWW